MICQPLRPCGWQINSIAQFAIGIQRITAPGHGGILLSDERLWQLPEPMRFANGEYEALDAISIPIYFSGANSSRKSEYIPLSVRDEVRCQTFREWAKKWLSTGDDCRPFPEGGPR